MTEARWLTCTDPSMMLRYVRRRYSGDRKFRLFAVAACHRIRHRLPDDRCRGALEVCERFAEGLASTDELKAAEAAAEAAFTEFDNRDGWETAAAAVSAACHFGEDVPAFAASAARQATWLVWPRTQRRLEVRWQAQVAHDTFGNPFRPVAVSPSWLTSTVTQIASGIYADRAFDRLPILADALQDAGCENPDLLDHCRSHGPHVRGCWAIDLVLEKV